MPTYLFRSSKSRLSTTLSQSCRHFNTLSDSKRTMIERDASTCFPGRTHRSNQVNAPEYIFLISDLAGERRFASTVAKRLESLGALTHGDRRATEMRDLSQFNIDNKYGGCRSLSAPACLPRH